MQVICPHCNHNSVSEQSEPKAEAWKCDACYHEFSLLSATAGGKDRKVPPPKGIYLDSCDPLDLKFEDRFALNLAIHWWFFGLLFTGSVYALQDTTLDGPTRLAAFVFACQCLRYSHIDRFLYLLRPIRTRMDKHTIRVVPSTLLGFVSQQGLKLAGVEGFVVKDRLLYRVGMVYSIWARRLDGSMQLVIDRLDEEYSGYIAGRLNRQLQADSDARAERLGDAPMENRLSEATEDAAAKGRRAID